MIPTLSEVHGKHQWTLDPLVDPYLNAPKVDASEHVDPERDCTLPSPKISYHLGCCSQVDEAQSAYLSIKYVVTSYTQYVCVYIYKYYTHE